MKQLKQPKKDRQELDDVSRTVRSMYVSDLYPSLCS